MPSKNPAQRLRDIIDNIDAVEAFTTQLDFPAFRMDRKTVYAVVRALDEAPIWHTIRHDLAALRGVATAEFDRVQSKP